MTTLHNILHRHEQTAHATHTGTQMHARLQHVFVDGDKSCGDTKLVEKIIKHPQIARLFVYASQTEVPIAGTINNRFISRRIDRLLIDHKQKTIDILDYKTDLVPDMFRDKYTVQIREYVTLLKQIYPEYDINGYILWIHDFLLEKLPIK